VARSSLIEACRQALSIVNERLNINKPPPPAPDPKSGKLAPGQINNNKDLDVESRKEEPSFFGSFFPSVKGQAKKKAGPVMESVSAAQVGREQRGLTRWMKAAGGHTTTSCSE